MNTRVLLIFTLAFIIIFSSCSKKAEDKLIGDWKQISVGGSHLKGKDITWTFAADRSLYRTTKTEETITIDTARWAFTARFATKNTLIIENLDQYKNGKHLIHELGDYLEIQRVEFSNGHTDGSFMWNEFEKQ